ncbi:MAG: outer membrane lipoprotein carrier protein LolA, partial [Flavobacteriales bacterium]|nr:outer membrane lipoprotein carrier protein LolA [Flavobacteriales bacterium]
LDRLVAKSKSYTSFEADFTSRLVNKADKLDVSQTGNVKTKDGKFRLQLEGNTVINDGKTLYTYNKDNNEVTLNDPSELGQEMDPSKLFTMYETGFKSQFVSEQTEGGVVTQTVKLFPTDPSKKPYHTVVLNLDKAKLEPKSVKILYKDANEVTYTLQRFDPKAVLADGLFVFDKSKYPGVEVNDMR